MSSILMFEYFYIDRIMLADRQTKFQELLLEEIEITKELKNRMKFNDPFDYFYERTEVILYKSFYLSYDEIRFGSNYENFKQKVSSKKEKGYGSDDVRYRDILSQDVTAIFINKNNINDEPLPGVKWDEYVVYFITGKCTKKLLKKFPLEHIYLKAIIEKLIAAENFTIEEIICMYRLLPN